MSSEKMQPSEDKLLQQLKKAYPQLAEELTEVLKRHDLSEVSEVEIRLNPTLKPMEENSRSEENFRKIPQPLQLRICLALQNGGTRCI